MADRILLTGVNGQVGGQLLPLLAEFGEVIAPLRAELDLSDGEALRRFVRDVQPRWIINPAAYTAVDKAEQEPALAHALNAVAPGILGQEAARLGAPVLHFSTDYVFPGDGDRPWTETDEPHPLGVYGTTKLAGERALAASGAAHFIFRTSWVYGATGNNFLRTILRLARDREQMKVVSDQHGAPTWSYDLARLIVHTMRRCEEQAAGGSLETAARALGGLYHACGAGETTWFGFAQQFTGIAQKAEPTQRFAELLPIPSSEYATPAARPQNSRMNCAKLAATLGFVMPDWQDSTAQVMQQLLVAARP